MTISSTIYKTTNKPCGLWCHHTEWISVSFLQQELLHLKLDLRKDKDKNELKLFDSI